MDKEIIENNTVSGNRLIAEFMGFVRKNRAVDSCGWKQWNIAPFGWFEDEDLKYHTSWDWLMPVIKKFASGDGGVPDFDKWQEWIDTINSAIERDYDIAEVFPYVVLAIQWYTQSK
jgi:hypothetical protein